MIDIPPLRRRLLGAALRQHREDLGYTLQDAALILECDRSKISRVETGQRGMRARDLRDLLTGYGVSEQEQRVLLGIANPEGARNWRKAAPDLPTAYSDYLVMERAASEIMAYGAQQIPDLLQTPGYSRAIAGASPESMAMDPDVTAARQQVILGERQPVLAVVIGEGALQQIAGDTMIVRAQLDQLLALAGNDHPEITVQVLPFASGAHPAAGSGSFSILRFAGAPSLGVVHLVGPASGICLVSTEEVTPYLRAFQQLQATALSPGKSAELIRQMASD